jgi:TPP-dependent pyruvate/acetoin dehydrogenase alpha subunit
MLANLFGPGSAETIAAMRAQAEGQAAPSRDPAERLARLRALRDSGVLTEAEYEAQRQRIIGTI